LTPSAIDACGACTSGQVPVGQSTRGASLDAVVDAIVKPNTIAINGFIVSPVVRCFAADHLQRESNKMRGAVLSIRDAHPM